MPIHPIVRLVATLPLAAALLSAGPVNSPPMLGINLSGAEFGNEWPGTFGRTYTYPGAADLDYYKARGLELIRLPFRWERIQPILEEPLAPEELARMDAFLDAAETRGMRVVLDMHNYARYHLHGKSRIIGSPELPRSAFRDVWERLAAHLKDRDCIWAYGIMNEPHSLGEFTWLESAQSAIDGIRKHDTRHAVLVPGEFFSGAHRWLQASAHLIKIKDPANNLIFEAHQYFDRDHSGKYRGDYKDEGARPDAGVERTRDFLAWCRSNQVRGFIGEYGVPDNDPRWLVVLDRTLSRMKAAGISGTYWSGGPWWGNYTLAAGPRSLHDEAPQMAVLAKYAEGPGTRHWPAFVWHGDADPRRSRRPAVVPYQSKGAFLFADAESDTAAFAGATGLFLNYTIPEGGHGGVSLDLEGEGAALARNFALGHELTFHASGTSGSSLGLLLVTAKGVKSAPVSLADFTSLDRNWREVRIPLTRFLTPAFNGADRIARLIIEGRPSDGRAYTVEIDELMVKSPQAPPIVTLEIAGGDRSRFPLRTAFEVTVSAKGADGGPVDFVEFILNGERVALSRDAPHTARITPPVAGTYRLAAIAYDRHGNPARSPVKTLTLTP